MGENQTTQAPMAGSAANQDARKPAIIIAAFFDPFALVIIRATFVKTAGEDRATPSPAPCYTGPQQETCKLTIITALLVLLYAFTLILFRALAYQVGNNRTTQAMTSRHAADQHAGQPTLLIATFLFLAALPLVRTLTHQMGENHTTQATTANHAADQDARKPTLLIAAFLYPFALVVVRATFAETAREDRATPSPAPHDPGPQQESRKLTIVVTAFLILLYAFALILFCTFRALAHQMGENRTTQATTAGHAADQDARKPPLLIAAFLFLLDLFDTLTVLALIAQETGNEQTPQALAAHHLSASQIPNKCLFVSVRAIMGRCISHEELLPGLWSVKRCCANAQQRAPAPRHTTGGL